MALPEPGGTNAELHTCAYCGSTVTVGRRHPVCTDESEDGDISLYIFCDTGCKDAWSREH
ncbi:DUF7576 family protein [Natronosalvus rutilus]|uniref:DUF7576 family protein n=1 Tax=Natronosalvus rutilus TaxID=2953753 RepID=UPI003CCD43A3